MCGIAGFWDPTASQTRDQACERALTMTDTVIHRGPDDGGVWVDETVGIALGNRRLAVVDLSPAGHQPMTSASGRWVIVGNLEIYNYPQLRTELLAEKPDLHFRGHCDTEVLVEAIDHWGLEPALQRLVGMFAIAVWDRQARTLTLARDRLGERPLYYGWTDDGVLLFGSELKALRAYPSCPKEINRDALALYFRYSCVPAPYSIYKGIYKLPPASYLVLSANQRTAAPVSYWSARAVAEQSVRDPFTGSEQEAIDTLDQLIRQSVAGQLLADVPLGAFLSGGVDSSTVVAAMTALQSAHTVKTFTIGFHESRYNEAEHAKAVAQHLKTDHTALYVTPEEARAVIPRLPHLYDEPFGDSSQIPTLLVCELARKHVTVSLSGDAGDELFGGYSRYTGAMRVWNKIGKLPQPLRTGLGQVANMVGLGKRINDLPDLLSAASPEALYQQLMSNDKHPTRLVLGSREPPIAMTTPSAWANVPDFAHRMMYFDLVGYLPDEMMVKLDRAALGVSLEGRVPLLDHRIIEFAWRLPLHLKIRAGQGKWILRQVLYRYVPRELIERPKQGFGVPIDTWLRGPLREWAEALLDESRLSREGYLQPRIIRQRWAEHLSGRRDWHFHLWDVLMFQAWLAHQMERT